MGQPKIVEALREIASNLWWAWQPDVWQIFREIDHNLWPESNHNPVAFLNQLDDEVIERRARENALTSRIQSARRRLQEYVAAGETPRVNMEAGPLHAAPVAYFCAEFGIHESLPIYSGGLGVLAGDHIKAASDLGVPIVGVGLFYVLGYFQQSIDEEGWQQEHYGKTEVSGLPLDLARGEDGEPLVVSVEANDSTIHAQIWKAQVGRNTLLLLDADVEQNNADDRQLTHVLYYDDRRTRLRQELLLGVGGVRALEALGIRPGVFHLNEGHSAFAPLELAYNRMRDEGIDFNLAWSRVKQRTVFTTHTPVPAGHDRFNLQMLDESTGPLRQRLGLDHYHFHALGRVNPNNPHETFCMTVLALKMSRHRNGVSNLHGRVSRRMWHGLWPHFESRDVPIGHITNGVHTSTFLAPQMRALYDKYLERDWELRQDQADAWSGLDRVDPAELWEVHQLMKSNLLDFIQYRVEHQQAPRGDADGQVTPGHAFAPDVLTIGFARRFATYKRAALLFEDPERLHALLNHPTRPVQFVFAGKAHPADKPGKKLIQRIVDASRDPAFAGRVVFLANYDLNTGRKLVQGVDVWLNNPRRPEEACGTSGQKVVLNGALNCSVLDGWWAEAYDGANGFAIGNREEIPEIERHDAHDLAALYATLENEVVPLYYNRDETGLPLQWIARMKWAIISLGWRFNANRMVLDYLRNAYLPAVGATCT